MYKLYVLSALTSCYQLSRKKKQNLLGAFQAIVEWRSSCLQNRDTAENNAESDATIALERNFVSWNAPPIPAPLVLMPVICM